MGYAGGTKSRPSYHAMGDHTECFQVDYDPSEVAYEDLLELFWQSHDPTRPAWKTQYASLVLTANDEQLAAAQESASRIEATFGKKLSTRIEPVGEFWLAEDYHQKYYLRGDRTLNSEFRAFYPAEDDFVNSTAAARVNAFQYGAGSCARLERELPGLGLSPKAEDHLRMHCR